MRASRQQEHAIASGASAELRRLYVLSSCPQEQRSSHSGRLDASDATVPTALRVDAGGRPSMATVWDFADGGNGHAYLVVTVPAGILWTDARVAAEEAGGHLATITTAAENAFVTRLAASTSSSWITFTSGQYTGVAAGPWLGASMSKGAWTWVTGEPWAFTGWSQNQPGGLPEDKLDLLGRNAPAADAAVNVLGWNDEANSGAGSVLVGKTGTGEHGYVIEFE